MNVESILKDQLKIMLIKKWQKNKLIGLSIYAAKQI